MALLNWTNTAYLVIIILISMRLRAADGVLIVKPQDTYVLAGQVVTLNCSTSSTEDVHWYYGTSYTYVYAGRKLISPFNNRLKVEVYQNDGTTAFNLVFLSTQPVDAGTYVCGDIQGRGQTSSAEMTVFTADGNRTCQSNMKPDGVVIRNDCNIDPDEVQLSCSVTYYGKNPPQLEWKKVLKDSNSVTHTECQTINNRVMCNTSITGDRKMNGSSYICQATGSSEQNISLCSIPVKNLIYALDGKTATNPTVGQEVQCNSETYQSCYYKWKHADTVISTSRAITPDRTGLYQCEAECNIRGKRCIVFGYVYVSDEDSTSCSTGCVVALCEGILILILLIIILIGIHRFLLRKRKGKRLQLQNKSPSKRTLEKNPAEYGTQQEQTGLIQSGEESETEEPKLIRTLRPNDTGKRTKGVFGVAILGEELFILLFECSEIEVFGDLQKLEPIRELILKNDTSDLKLELPWDIQSCSHHKCLYIVDNKRGAEQTAEIIRIDPDGNVQHKWKTECKRSHLSITYEFNVIITSFFENKIMEYSSDGCLIRLIEWPPSVGIVTPWITLKRRENEYIVSHGSRGEMQQRVCLIELKGNIKHTFGGKKGSNYDQLHLPIYMAAYSDGHIFVADQDNSRVMLLSPELKFLKTLLSTGDYLRSPSRVCLDERNRRLFVGDNQWINEQKPYHNGRVLVFDMSDIQTRFKKALNKN